MPKSKQKDSQRVSHATRPTQESADRHKGTEKRPRSDRWVLIFWIAIALIALNLLTGIFSYGFMMARCGHPPITASTFASDYHYYTPGQVGYGPSILHDKYFCSTEEAERAGFNAY